MGYFVKCHIMVFIKYSGHIYYFILNFTNLNQLVDRISSDNCDYFSF